jgi:hypothetical protein
MTTVTTAAVKRVLTKGLTGWQAGKLVLQDMIDSFLRRESVLTEADMAAIQQIPMEGADVRDYNMFMALCRGFHRGCILAELACKDACLQIDLLDHAFQDADKRRTVELFESFGPHVVTRKQYEEIVAAQREKKLEFEYSLSYVIERRFYAVAPPEAEQQISEAGADIESLADFVAAMPETYADVGKQVIDQIHRLHTSGKLPAIYHEEDAKQVEPLLAQWRENGLASKEAIKLIDLLYVTGQTLYDCAELAEWKASIDQYQRHWCADEDERFEHAYAVIEDCPAVWLDKKGRYKEPSKPSEWITHSTEFFLGLIDHHGKPGKSIEQVGDELRARLDAAEQNIRTFLAVKAVLDTAADAVEMDVPTDAGVLAGANTRLDAFIQLFNLRLEELKEERKSCPSGETRLEKALKTLPAIEVDKLKPNPDSLAQLKSKILHDARGEDWLRMKAESLVCGDGITFKDLMK